MSLASLLETSTTKRQAFQPGDAIPYSGIYRAIHRKRHTPDHDLTCVSDRLFPLCNECGDGVEFRLLRAVRLIDKHGLFRPAHRSLPWAQALADGEPEMI